MEGVSELWDLRVALALSFSRWFCRGSSILRLAFGSSGSSGSSGSGGRFRVVIGDVSGSLCGFRGFSGELRTAMVVLVGLCLFDFVRRESIAASGCGLPCFETTGDS